MLRESNAIPVGFAKGLNTIADENSLPRGERGEYLSAREATNVDISKTGLVRRRRGKKSRLALTKSHSGWSAQHSRGFGVVNGNLVEFDCGVSPPAIKATLTSVAPELPMAYAEAAGMVFFSNAESIGRLVGDAVSEVWPETPEVIPAAVVTTGGFLPPAQYHLAFTWVETATRIESGSTAPMVVVVDRSAGDVTAPGSNTSLPANAIVLTGLPQKPGHSLNVYCNAPGGETLHRQATIPYGTTGYTMTQATVAGKKLEHLLLADRMPAGHALETYKGRLLVAVEDTVWYSLPGSYGLTRLQENFLPFTSRVTLLAATENGVFVGTSSGTYFVSDIEAAIPTIQTVHAAVPTEGTYTRIPITLVGQNVEGLPSAGDVPYWFSDKGPMVGLPGGKVLPLAEDSVVYRAYGRGASQIRLDGGIASVVTAVRDPGAVSRMGVGDSVAVEVIRAGTG